MEMGSVWLDQGQTLKLFVLQSLHRVPQMYWIPFCCWCILHILSVFMGDLSGKNFLYAVKDDQWDNKNASLYF